MDDGEMVCGARRWRAAVSEERILRLRDNLFFRPLPRPGFGSAPEPLFTRWTSRFGRTPATFAARATVEAQGIAQSLR